MSEDFVGQPPQTNACYKTVEASFTKIQSAVPIIPHTVRAELTPALGKCALKLLALYISSLEAANDTPSSSQSYHRARNAGGHGAGDSKLC